MTQHPDCLANKIGQHPVADKGHDRESLILQGHGRVFRKKERFIFPVNDKCTQLLYFMARGHAMLINVLASKDCSIGDNVDGRGSIGGS